MLENTPRLFFWKVLTLVMLVLLWVLEPQQLPVVLYKISLVVFAAVVGYWLDRSLFHYARPHELFSRSTAQFIASNDNLCRTYLLAASAATIRRSLIMVAVIIGVTLGL